jgi:hypothetical protein
MVIGAEDLVMGFTVSTATGLLSFWLRLAVRSGVGDGPRGRTLRAQLEEVGS